MKSGRTLFHATTLHWLYAGLALAALPHGLHLPPWIPLLAILIGLWSYLIARRRLPVPPDWVRLGVALAVAAGIYASFGRLFGRDAGVGWLIILLTIKLLELNTRRDAMLVVFLAYFLVVTNFLYTQAIPTALLMLLVVLVITSALIALNRNETPLPTRRQLWLAGRLLLQAIPMMLVLFVLFPRISGPLWGMPQDAYGGVSGLSDSMSPGRISQLSLSDAVAFRVDFDGPIPAPEQRYWRGPVLWNFDGETWRLGGNRSTEAFDDFTPLGAPVNYTVTLEPHNRLWLFGLEMPDQAPAGGRLLGDHQLLAGKPVNARLRYRLSSHLHYRTGELLTEAVQDAGLQLPAASHPRLRALAARWRSETPDARALVERVLRYFTSENFVYTLAPPRLGRDAMDSFFFDTRRGFCEHYAGAFVILMRAAGIPARVVTGYQGGEINPLGNYLIVRQSDAHAWAEVWLENAGWVRVDPTAAVSPLRIERGLRAAVPATDPLPALMRINSAFVQRVRLALDTLNNRWNQWVLNYGEKQQVDFLARFGLGLEKWENMILALVVTLGTILGLIALGMLWQRPRHSDDPAWRCYQTACRKLARAGLPRTAHEGPADYADRISHAWPELAEGIQHITRCYIAARYAPQPSAAQHASSLEALRLAVRHFAPRRQAGRQ